MESAESRISEFVHFSFPPVEDGEAYPATRSLLESGVIDSMGVLTVVSWLEEEFGIMVEDEEVVPENLDSIASLARYVARKQLEAGLAG